MLTHMQAPPGQEWLERQYTDYNSDFLEAIADLDVHDHLALIYEFRQEQFDAVIPFIKRGLEANQRCIYVVDDNTADAVFAQLSEEGVDVAAVRADDQLVVTDKERTYLQDGYFDPDEMIQFLADETDRAIADGFDALRVTGEMTWMLGGDPGTDRLMEYEAKLNEFLPAHETLAICQYNRDRFSSEIIRDVIRTHPQIIYNYAVLDNFYYQEPDVFRSGEVTDIVENQLHAIAEQHYRETKLQEQQQRLTVLNRVVRHDLRNDMTVLI